MAKGMRSAGAVVLGSLSLLSLGGCQHLSGAVSDEPADSAYSGPLYVSADGLERHDPVRETGAAGQVVECATQSTGGFEDDQTDGGVYDGAASDSPAAAIDEALGTFAFSGATAGFRMAAEDDDRVLFTYEVEGVPKQAMIVHFGETIGDHEGWYLEAWAVCDLSEFPPDVVEATGAQLWTDADGNPAPTTDVVSYAGPEHCDWQSMTFLYVDNGAYVGDLQPELRDYVVAPPRSGVPLPDDAVETPYRREGHRLWLSSDETIAYVGTASSVDAWPRTVPHFGCG